MASGDDPEGRKINQPSAENETHPEGRAGASRDATLQGIVAVLHRPGLAEEFLSARPSEAIKILKRYGMEEELKAYIIAAAFAKQGLELPSAAIIDANENTIRAEEEIAAAIAIRHALLEITSVYHHDPIALRAVAMDCLEVGDQISHTNDFRTLMYQTIISEIGQGNPVVGAQTIMRTHQEWAEGDSNIILSLISENSKRQEVWRRVHNPKADRIDDVKLFALGQLTCEGLYEAAERVMAAQHRIGTERNSTSNSLG